MSEKQTRAVKRQPTRVITFSNISTRTGSVLASVDGSNADASIHGRASRLGGLGLGR